MSKFNPSRRRGLPKLHRYLLFALLLSLPLLIFWPKSPPPRATSIALDIALAPVDGINLPLHELPSREAPSVAPSISMPAPLAATTSDTNTDISEAATEVTSAPAPTNMATEIGGELTYDIRDGDSLSSIFDRLGISQNTMFQIMQADSELLALDILRPGNRLLFELDENSAQLNTMELFINAANRVLYKRSEEGFYFEEIILPGDWQTHVLKGEIQGSFYLSAERIGLTPYEIQQVSQLFREQLDFSRQIQAGDVFEVVRSRQLVEGEFTGQSRIEAVRLHRRRMTHTAYLFEDGNYYDVKAESLARAFLRRPLQSNFRISSAFNGNRLHPVTGKRAPHNGTDFATPNGTPIISIGDGVVTRVDNHPFAGRYLEIEHSGQYKSRYLHMSRVDVKRGQRVSRGERIGLSGSTGRVTGPHLHYEFHINGRPVNPMTAKIPLATSVPKAQQAKFKARVESINTLIAAQTQNSG